MDITRRAWLRKASLLATAVPLSACGTLMYPERRGQRGGRIDAGVAVLDGLGLLLFLVPGIIAFAVDFHTGAIYMPGTYGEAEGDTELVRKDLDKPLDDAEMDRIWQESYGRARPFRNVDVESRPLASLDDVDAAIRVAAAKGFRLA